MALVGCAALSPVCLYTQQCLSSERTRSGRRRDRGRRRFPRRGAERTHEGAGGRYPDGMGRELLVKRGRGRSSSIADNIGPIVMHLPILPCEKAAPFERERICLESKAAGTQAYVYQSSARPSNDLCEALGRVRGVGGQTPSRRACCGTRWASEGSGARREGGRSSVSFAACRLALSSVATRSEHPTAVLCEAGGCVDRSPG